MNLGLYFLGLKLVQFVLKLLPKNNYEDVDSFIAAGKHVQNIFAWVNQFIPTDLLLILVAMTTTLIVSKFFYRLLMSVLGNFK